VVRAPGRRYRLGGGTVGRWALHQRLIHEGALVLEPDGMAMRFARDQVFASPSAAAAVVAGRQANGRVEWKIQGSGLSFGGWQDQGVDQAAGRGHREVLPSSWPVTVAVPNP
jgi:Domain of unknown function (DUF4357)